MKYITNYRKFTEFKNKKSKSSDFHFYEIGKLTNKSIFECGLISEGFKNTDILLLKENLNFYRLDDLIIKSIYDRLRSDSSINEEINLGNIWNTTKNAWNKGVKFLGDTFNNFKDFLKKIGNVIGNLFKKVTEAFKKLWEITKNVSINLIKGVKNWVISSSKESALNTLAETINDNQFSKETTEVVNDLKSVKSRFVNGEVGSMSDETKKKMEEEAEEYDGVDNLEEIKNLIEEKYILYSSDSVKKVYYSLKGYLLEGHSIDDLSQFIFEADEYKEGDTVKYKTEKGEELEKEIVKIEGDNFFFKDNEGVEFSKKKEDIISKVDTEQPKKVTGKMGIMGWVVECFKLITKPVEYIVNQSLKLGMNGVLILISAFARKGFNNAYKYQKFGPVVGKVNDIISGEMQEDEAEEEIQVQGPQQEEDSKNKTTPTKNKKLNNLFSDITKVLAPILGQVLCACFEAQVGPVLTVLKYTLLVVSAIELVSALCKKGVVKGAVCQISNFSLN